MAFEASADKLEEANHFLLLMRVAELPEEDSVPARLQGQAAFRYAFSAFVSAARAILQLLPEEGVGVPGFTRWYVTARERWLRTELAAFFGEQREFRLRFSDGTSEVAAPISTGRVRIEPVSAARVPEVDLDVAGQVAFADRREEAVTTACARYLTELAALVNEARGLVAS